MEALVILNYILLIGILFVLFFLNRNIKKNESEIFEWGDLQSIKEQIISQINIGLDIQTKARGEIQDNYFEHKEHLDNLEIELKKLHSINSHFEDTQRKSVKSIQEKISKNHSEVILNQGILSDNQIKQNQDLLRLGNKIECEFDIIEKQYVFLRNKMNPILDANSIAYSDLQKKYDILFAQKSHIHLQKQLDVVSAERNQLRAELNKHKEKKDKIETERFNQLEKEKEKQKAEAEAEAKKKGRPVGQKNSPTHKAGRPKKNNNTKK